MTSLPSVAPAVSVLVPAYNGQRYLARALDSALAQRFDDLEVVIVNDGSIDATEAIALAYRGAHPRRIVYLRQDNAGLPAARNAALQVARGRYVALLDCDDVWLPEHLATLVPVLEASPRVALVHSNITRIDAEGAVLGTLDDRWPAGSEADAFAELFLRRQHVACPTAVMRRAALDAVGWFDRRFTGLGCEDRDLWLRLALRYDVRYVDRVTALYRMHGGSMSTQLEKMTRARKMLVDKYLHEPRARALAAAAHAAIDLELGAVLRDAGKRGEACLAYCRAAARKPTELAAWKGMAGSLIGRKVSAVPAVAA